MIMNAITTKKKSISYLFFSWLGRKVYGLRLQLERFNDWVDLKAGEYLEEEEPPLTPPKGGDAQEVQHPQSGHRQAALAEQPRGALRP